MPEPRRHVHSSARLFLALVSVLALLASACFPVLAYAEVGVPEYEAEIPTVPGHTKQAKHRSESNPSAERSSNGGGGGGSSPGGTGGSGSGSGSSGGQSSAGGANGATDNNGGGTGQGSQGNGSTAKPATGQQAASKSVPASNSGGSSPLVPILVAIAVLAAISIGVVVWRQRRGGAPVSPKAS